MVARVADSSAGVSVFVSNATNGFITFSASTFFLSWNNDTVNALAPCESSSRVLMAGVWSSNMTGVITFHLQSRWPAKLRIDLKVLIDSTVENFHRTATFLVEMSVFHEIGIEFTCVSPSMSSFVSLQYENLLFHALAFFFGLFVCLFCQIFILVFDMCTDSRHYKSPHNTWHQAQFFPVLQLLRTCLSWSTPRRRTLPKRSQVQPLSLLEALCALL